MMFRDRHHAGQVLADCLLHYAARDDAMVLALPGGGVAVGAEVARALRLPFDVFVARRFAVPGHPDLALGAIARGQVTVVDERMVERFGLDAAALANAEADAMAELQRCERACHDAVPVLPVAGRTVLLVDDGFADTPTLLAAIRALRRQAPARIVLAVPVAATELGRRVAAETDDFICARTPAAFGGPSCWYADVGHTSDREVLALLTLAREDARLPG